MAKPRLEIGTTVERLRESLWLIPGVMVAGAVGLATLLIGSRAPAPEIPLRYLLLPPSAEAAVPVLQVLAASVITVTSVVFSLTVVALQITAGNYSPRALRTFLRDMGTQIVLGTFVATFAYAYLVLQNLEPLRGQTEATWGPQLAFMAVPGFVLASLIALVFFIHHVTQAVRVDFILREVLEENIDSIATVHPQQRRGDAGQHPRDVIPDNAVDVISLATGFVQAFDLSDLLDALAQTEFAVAYRPSVGDHVLEGASLAWVWDVNGSTDEDFSDIEQAVHDAIHLGSERSMDQDVAFGIRQLVDIAVRALSPGVNDPNTAVSALLHLSVVYRTLLSRQLGPVLARDGNGVARIMVPYPTLAEYLTIMVQQIGHYGRSDVMVVLRLLRVLAELKSLALSQDHDVLDRAIDDVVLEAERGIDVDNSLQLVRDAARDAKEMAFRFRHYTAAG